MLLRRWSGDCVTVVFVVPRRPAPSAVPSSRLRPCLSVRCKSSDPTWAFEGVKRLNCDWVAEKRERCTESGIVMEEFEESEDDEDPNKPGPVEAYAFRACGKACGTCE